MIYLRAEINKKLKEIHDNVHYQVTGEKFPHVVFDFPNSFMQGDMEVFNLDIDVWDNKVDTMELETISSSVWKMFNRYHHIDDKIQFSVYRDNRLPPLDEDDKNIRRRKLVFQLRYLNRED